MRLFAPGFEKRSPARAHYETVPATPKNELSALATEPCLQNMNGSVNEGSPSHC